MKIGLMDFQRVLSLIIERFDSVRIPYALIGGVALGLWGVVRGTQGIDILSRKTDMPEISEIMTSMGYKVFHNSENVMQFAHDLNIFGSVDYLYAFRKSTFVMLDRAVEKKLSSGMSLKVVLPDDLIALKMQSMLNNPALKEREMRDIIDLVEMQGDSMNWDDIRAYANTLKMEDVYEKLCSYRRNA